MMDTLYKILLRWSFASHGLEAIFKLLILFWLTYIAPSWYSVILGA